MPADATAVADPRVEPAHRAAHIPERYSAGKHIARTALLAIGIGGFAASLARTATAADWLLLPVFVAVANVFEWLVHRGPMHRPMTPRIMYKNHALLHHKAFHHDSMPVHEPRELYLIMMPWYTMLGLFVAASPVAIVAALLRGPGAAGVFFIAAAGYFLLYETLHALYHLPEATLERLGLRGNGVFDRLQSHHRHHHRLSRMAKVNFNVTFPMADWAFGTMEKEAADADGEAAAEQIGA